MLDEGGDKPSGSASSENVTYNVTKDDIKFIMQNILNRQGFSQTKPVRKS